MTDVIRHGRQEPMLPGVTATDYVRMGREREAREAAATAAAEALAAALHEAGRYGIWPHGTTVHVTGQCGTCDSFARWLMSQPALAWSLTREGVER